MSTHFYGEGNIGSAPEYREFPNGNDEPNRRLRLNVYFDNPIPKRDGEYEDRNGFWAPVNIWQPNHPKTSNPAPRSRVSGWTSFQPLTVRQSRARYTSGIAPPRSAALQSPRRSTAYRKPV